MSPAPTKDRIISEIRRTADSGIPLGQEKFSEVTGISIAAWRGKFWRRWSEAVTEAGFEPNRVNEAFDEATLVGFMIMLMRQNGHFPTYGDLRMARTADSSFPGHQAFNRLGDKVTRIGMVRRYCEAHPGHEDVLAALPGDEAEEEVVDDTEALGDGSVYLLKLGKHHKIGHTFSVPRRHREIGLELPEKPDVVHVITTDDPSGIEAYWHRRFATKRTNGEWFTLTREDVRAFKRRKFM